MGTVHAVARREHRSVAYVPGTQPGIGGYKGGEVDTES